MFKYLKKEKIKILIPNIESFKYDKKYWKIKSNTPKYVNSLGSVQIGEKILNLWPDTIEKEFFVFVFIGDNFPIINKKEKLVILHKYNFSKIYISKNNQISCYYFKRGVLFDIENINNENLLQINRLFKLIKLKTKSENDIIL